MVAAVGERHEKPDALESACERRRLAGESEGGPAQLVGCDLDVVPPEGAAEGFCSGLFRGEARGIVGCGICAAVAVNTLSGREQARCEARPSLQRAADSVYLDDVYAEGGGHQAPIPRRQR